MTTHKVLNQLNSVIELFIELFKHNLFALF